jgi:hypothetical protein
MLKEFKAPDKKAPRQRMDKLTFFDSNFYKKFIKEFPQYKNLSLKEFKNIIWEFNGAIWKKIVETRDGIELPEQLGYLFVGTCTKTKKINTDFYKSNSLGVNVKHQNWESDNYIAKIFYTNFEQKYTWKYHELWTFKAIRYFKQGVAKEYRVRWKQYLMVDNLVRASKAFRQMTYKHKKNKEDLDSLEYYDEFEI